MVCESSLLHSRSLCPHATLLPKLSTGSHVQFFSRGFVILDPSAYGFGNARLRSLSSTCAEELWVEIGDFVGSRWHCAVFAKPVFYFLENNRKTCLPCARTPKFEEAVNTRVAPKSITVILA